LNRLKFVLESRGIGNSLERLWQVGTRFGLTAARMERRLVAYHQLVAAHGAAPSLPITARVLARNPHIGERLVALGAELCVHGLVHNDLSNLRPEIQTEQIEAACRIFREHGIAYTGFRSPYLRYNAATLAAVEKAGFDYDSNMPFYWEPRGLLERLSSRQKDGLERGLAFYNPARHPAERSTPRLTGRLVEIPVSLPDDEILLDRMGLSPEAIGRVWQEILECCRARGDLFTVQLHPERLLILHRALGNLLKAAALSGRVWIATLGEISRWWRERQTLQLEVSGGGGSAYRITSAAPLKSSLCLVEPLKGTSARITLPAQVVSPLRPVIGFHPDSPLDLRVKIKERGYIIELTADSKSYPIYAKPGCSLHDLAKAIGELDHALLVQSTWPAPFEAALAVTGDIDCLTLGDFLRRFKEN